MRAATSLSGSLADMTPMAKAPVRRLTASRTASSRGSSGSSLSSCSMRWAMISVSVSVTKVWPLAVSSFLRAR